MSKKSERIRLCDNRPMRAVPLEGVPQIPDDVADTIGESGGRQPTEEQEARTAEAIAAACAELLRRHGWPDEPETHVPVHVHEFGERPALRRKRSSEA